jgi:phosphate:Na+ symporter
VFSLTIGGLGLFLFGMSLMTDGLKLAGGKTLNYVLQRWTATRLRGFTTGFIATALVQSSSAVSVSVIGFVNAGMLNLAQSMWVIYGSNVGTTMTAWIVALIGLKIKVDIIALPAIGLGSLAYLFARRVRWRALGGAFAGLGMIFFGLSLMQQAFAGVADQLDLSWLGGGLLGLLGLIVLGALLTALMQSSSAALAVVLTAVSTGLLSLEAGAGAVIGANLGTTVTAILAVIGATSTAKRVATAHVIFNLLAAGIALLLLSLMLTAVSLIQDSLHLDPNPAVSLAIFHTLFNLAGVLIMIPVATRVTDYLETRFISKTELVSKPEFLDQATATSPDSAARALILEEKRLLDLVREMLLSEDSGDLVVKRVEVLNSLIAQIDEFISLTTANKIPAELAEFFQHVISVNLHTADVLDNRRELEQLSDEALPEEVRSVLTHLLSYLHQLLEVGVPSAGDTDPIDRILVEFQQEYENLGEELKAKVRSGDMNMHHLQSTIRYLATLRRVIRQFAKSLKYFAEMQRSGLNF